MQKTAQKKIRSFIGLVGLVGLLAACGNTGTSTDNTKAAPKEEDYV